MIAFLRHLIFEDFWLKLFSLGLAVLIWLTVTFASQPEGQRVFADLPVRIVSSAADVRSFQVNPRGVDVTVQGNAKIVQGLQSQDIRVIVDLTGLETAQNLHKPVEVSTPAGVSYVRVEPREVQVSKVLNNR